MTTIGLAGDWHGTENAAKHALSEFHQLGITDIYHLGDFGVWSPSDWYLKNINRHLENNNQTLWVTLGNHENYDLLNKITVPHPDLEYATYAPSTPRILFLNRGVAFTIEGIKFVSLGGATSIDRFMRVEGREWWAGEQITDADIQATLRNETADVLLTHATSLHPDTFNGQISNLEAVRFFGAEGLMYAESVRAQLQEVVNALKPKLNFFGHYHVDYHASHFVGENSDSETVFICLNKEWEKRNIALLHLPTLEVSYPRLEQN